MLYKTIDCRLGSNKDFQIVCNNLHENDIKIVFDGVFNHVGRGFWAFKDLLLNRENSKFKDWFVNVNFNGNNVYNDGLYYEGWEGHFELVKLNLQNDIVVQYLFECISTWIKEFNIDGLRLDVAYSLNAEFLKKLRKFCDSQKLDFYLLGEVLHGDYNRLMNEQMLHSVTNYQAYKGIWSSFNDMNMFEINSTLERHFNAEYVGKHMLNFVDNHDVERIASILKNPEHLKLVFALMFAIPGIPCIYYGSEWGALGKKQKGNDDLLRPYFEEPINNDLTKYIAKLSEIYKNEKALTYGSYKKLFLTNKQIIFERSIDKEKIIIAINSDSTKFNANFKTDITEGIDLITGNKSSIVELPPISVSYLKV